MGGGGRRWGLRGQPQGRAAAAPGSQLQPLSRMAQGRAAAGHHLLAHTGSPGGNRGWGWLKVTKDTVGQPVTSPVTVDPGGEGVLAPKEAGAWRSGPADWAERRASRSDRRGPSRPRLSPSALGRGGRAGGNRELLRAPRLSPSPVHSLASYGDIAGPGRTHHSAQAGLQGGCQIPVPPTPRRPGATLPQNCRVGSVHRCHTQGAPLRPCPPSSTSKPSAGPGAFSSPCCPLSVTALAPGFRCRPPSPATPRAGRGAPSRTLSCWHPHHTRCGEQPLSRREASRTVSPPPGNLRGTWG